MLHRETGGAVAAAGVVRGGGAGMAAYAASMPSWTVWKAVPQLFPSPEAAAPSLCDLLPLPGVGEITDQLSGIHVVDDGPLRHPDFEILGLFVLLLIGFVLFLEGGHVAGLTVNGSEFPYIPQWITIFILLLMFSVDFYQNWLERKREQKPVELRRRKK